MERTFLEEHMEDIKKTYLHRAVRTLNEIIESADLGIVKIQSCPGDVVNAIHSEDYKSNVHISFTLDNQIIAYISDYKTMVAYDNDQLILRNAKLTTALKNAEQRGMLVEVCGAKDENGALQVAYIKTPLFEYVNIELMEQQLEEFES